MSEVQFEDIVRSAITQADDQVEACVVFLDDRVATSIADVVLQANRWAVCMAGQYALLRALGASLRFPDLEIIVGIEATADNQAQLQRCLSLFEEMALTNVTVFACGESAPHLDSVLVFECETQGQLRVHPWQACPVHVHSYTLVAADCAQPAAILKRMNQWGQDDTLIEMWDAHQYGDLAYSLMVAAQYAAQGRQVWTILEPEDLADPEVLMMVRAIGEAHLPLKCLVFMDYEEAKPAVPWSQWSRMNGWWVHLPMDASEALSWVQSSIDHMWSSLICLPSHWCTQLEAASYSRVRTIGSTHISVPTLSNSVVPNTVSCALLCCPNMLAECMQALQALQTIGFQIEIKLITSLAPLSYIECGTAQSALIVDGDTIAPIADVILPILQGQNNLRVDLCGPAQCQAARPKATDIAARVRALAAAI